MPGNKHSLENKWLYSNLSYGAKEAYKRLRTNVQCSFESEDCHVIGITSPNPSEGKSISSINLAISLSELGKRVILVDADMLRPSVHEKLGLVQSPGLTNLLTDTDSIDKTVQQCQFSEELEIDVIPTGTRSANPSQLIVSKRMDRLIAVLREVYDYVIMDLPPVGSVADVIAVSNRVDGIAVVMRESYCYKSQLKQCVDQLLFAKANILGFIINGSKIGTRSYHKYGKYGSYGYYGSGYYADGQEHGKK